MAASSMGMSEFVDEPRAQVLQHGIGLTVLAVRALNKLVTS